MTEEKTGKKATKPTAKKATKPAAKKATKSVSKKAVKKPAKKATKATTKRKENVTLENLMDYNEKDFTVQEINEIANSYYNDHLKEGEKKIKGLRGGVKELKDLFGAFGPDIMSKIDDFGNAIDDYEKQSKITFKHCEKFVLDGDPVDFNILKDDSKALHAMAEKFEKAHEVLKIVKAMIPDEQTIISMKDFFLHTVSELKDHINEEVKQNLKYLNPKEKKQANELLDSVNKLYDKMVDVSYGKTVAGDANAELENVKSKLEIFEKTIRKKERDGGR